MKFFIFGTCSGTEPMPGRHHVSFAVEHDDGLYWFDAGETCSRTAHLMGVDLMRIRKIMISHAHDDHIGGLFNLIFNIRKLDGMHHTLRCRDIELLIPDLRVWRGLLAAYRCAEGHFTRFCDTDLPDGCGMTTELSYDGGGFRIHAREYGDGLLCSEGGLRVSALHNGHLVHWPGQPWRSFGFLLEAEGKRAVYSGDTEGVGDFASLLPCDLLLMESGHHDPLAVARELIARGQTPGMLAFIHHGRIIINDRDGVLVSLRELLGGGVRILEDGDILEA